MLATEEMNEQSEVAFCRERAMFDRLVGFDVTFCEEWGLFSMLSPMGRGPPLIDSLYTTFHSPPFLTDSIDHSTDEVHHIALPNTLPREGDKSNSEIGKRLFPYSLMKEAKLVYIVHRFPLTHPAKKRAGSVTYLLRLKSSKKYIYITSASIFIFSNSITVGEGYCNRADFRFLSFNTGSIPFEAP